VGIDAVRCVARSPTTRLRWGRAPLETVRRGVDVSVLLSPAMFDVALAAIDGDHAMLAMAQGAFALRVTDDVYVNFYLINGEEVCLEVSDPLAPDRCSGCSTCATAGSRLA